jgi:hypothetical protein
VLRRGVERHRWLGRDPLTPAGQMRTSPKPDWLAVAAGLLVATALAVVVLLALQLAAA